MYQAEPQMGSVTLESNLDVSHSTSFYLQRYRWLFIPLKICLKTLRLLLLREEAFLTFHGRLV